MILLPFYLQWHHLLLLLGTGTFIYTVGLVLYRLYLSPIAAIPGPFLAKVTHWYEFYHNFIRSGMYYVEIRDMHRKYGML